jgi:hypothetical protein
VATQDINHPKIEMEGNLVGLEPVTNLGGGGGLKRLRTNQVAILLPAVKEKKGEKKKRTGQETKDHWSRAPRGFRGCGGVRGDVIFHSE